MSSSGMFIIGGRFVVGRRVYRREACVSSGGMFLSSGGVFVVRRRGRCSKNRRDEHDDVSIDPSSTARGGAGRESEALTEC